MDHLNMYLYHFFPIQVCESNEPVDVRKNRQLTLDNMKLSREVERIKAQTTENELLKKELKNVRAKLEEEQNTRTKIQARAYCYWTDKCGVPEIQPDKNMG